MTNTSYSNLANAIHALQNCYYTDYSEYVVYITSTAGRILMRFKLCNMPKNISQYLAKRLIDYDITDEFKIVYIKIVNL